MIPCFNHEGMMNIIGWYAAQWIFGQIDASHAECVARMAADPTYKPNPWADKPTAGPRKTNEQALADYCATIRAGATNKDWSKK